LSLYACRCSKSRVLSRVAALVGGQVIESPGPEFVLEAGDKLHYAGGVTDMTAVFAMPGFAADTDQVRPACAAMCREEGGRATVASSWQYGGKLWYGRRGDGPSSSCCGHFLLSVHVRSVGGVAAAALMYAAEGAQVDRIVGRRRSPCVVEVVIADSSSLARQSVRDLRFRDRVRPRPVDAPSHYPRLGKVALVCLHLGKVARAWAIRPCLFYPRLGELPVSVRT
jgi:hypothetical protein